MFLTSQQRHRNAIELSRPEVHTGHQHFDLMSRHKRNKSRSWVSEADYPVPRAVQRNRRPLQEFCVVVNHYNPAWQCNTPSRYQSTDTTTSKRFHHLSRKFLGSREGLVKALETQEP